MYKKLFENMLSYTSHGMPVEKFMDDFEKAGLDKTLIIDVGESLIIDRFIYYYKGYPIKIQNYAKPSFIISELKKAIGLIDESFRTNNIPEDIWIIIPQHQYIHVINSKFRYWNNTIEKYDFVQQVFKKRDYDSNLIDVDILKESFANCSEFNLQQSIEYIKSNFEVNNNSVVIYRGVQDRSAELKDSLSWTLDKNVALFFAKRFPGSKRNAIYKTTVDLDDIIGFSEHEKEIIVQYEKLKGTIEVEVI